MPCTAYKGGQRRMMERVYTTMKNVGAANIAIGVTLIVLGLAAGILTIITGAKLLIRKDDVAF